MSAAIEQRNQEATCYVGNLDEKVNEELLWELMVQCGPVVNVFMPKDKVTSKHLGYGFVEYRSEEDAEYAMKIMNMIKVYGKAIKLNKASADKKQSDIGANVFVGNLDADVDEKLLYDTFSAFGGILQVPKIMRDADTGMSKGYGFVSFDSFEASDLAIECMNGQYLANRPISVQYAFKKDAMGERYGSQVERMMAATNNQQRFKPHTMFSTGAAGDVVNMNTNAMPSALQYQQQQQQFYNQQMAAMAAAGYGMAMPMPMMPMAATALPQYLQHPGMAAPMMQPMAPMSVPPPPSMGGYPAGMMMPGVPPPPPPMPGQAPAPPTMYMHMHMPGVPPPPPPM
jgi:splicing factor 3B subunit 4